MKKIILYILIPFFLFSLSGCNYLRGEGDDPYMEDEMTEEEDFDESSDEFLVEEEEFEEEEFEEPMEEEDFEEEEGEGKRKGFFSRLFGGGEEDEEEENLDNYEDGDFSMEDSYPEESFAEEESALEDFESIGQAEITATEGQAQTEETTTAVAKEEPIRKTLNKILKYPYNKSGVLVNAVYIARSGENLQNISQKIYGRDNTGELFAVNTHLRGRDLVVGDKIYYNSPNRPNDNKRILFYYEDNNLSPSYYNLSAGENIRTVAYQLLGHPKSWKEIWATNPDLGSKGEVQENFRIVYWEGGGAPSAPVSQPVASQPQVPVVTTAQNDNLHGPNLPGSNLPGSNLPGSNLPGSNLPDLSQPAQEVAPPSMTESLPEKQVPSFPGQNKPPLEDNRKPGSDVVSFLMENTTWIGIAIAFLIIFILIFRIVLKKRKQRDFDYTSV